MCKIIRAAKIALLGLALFSSAAMAQSNSMTWKLTVDQKAMPKYYHVVSSFVDAATNNILGSVEITYPQVSGDGVVYVTTTNNSEKMPVGYIQASFAQLANASQSAQFYSVNCYDLNRIYNQKVYLNFPQDFSRSKPNCK